MRRGLDGSQEVGRSGDAHDPVDQRVHEHGGGEHGGAPKRRADQDDRPRASASAPATTSTTTTPTPRRIAGS
jgi:hypothetical protein